MALLGTGVTQVVVLHLLIEYVSATRTGIIVRGIALILLPFVANYLASQMAAFTTNKFQLTLLAKLSGTRTNDIEQLHAHTFSKAATLDVDHLFQFWKELFSNIGFNLPIILYLLASFLGKLSPINLLLLCFFVCFLFGIAYTTNQFLKTKHREHHQAYISLQDRIRNYVENVLQFRLYRSEASYLQDLSLNLTYFSKLSAQLSHFRQLYSTTVSSILLVFLWGSLWFMQNNRTLSATDLAVATIILLEIRRITTELFHIVHTYQKAGDSVERLSQWLDIDLPDELDKTQSLPAVAICLENLTFSYKKGFQTIRYPDMEIQPGEKVWLKGSNGRGKSTLWKILTGLYTNSTTTIWLNELPRQGNGLNPFWNRVSAVTEPPRCYSGTLWEIIGNFSSERTEIVNWLTTHQLLTLFDTYPHQLDTYYDSAINNLSAGQLKWLLIIQAFYLQPEVLILDEPLSSLDVDRQAVTLSLINQLPSSTTLIIISHHKVSALFTKTITI
ncbi:ABC transporter ATP-binding protein [Spirosoma sp. KNUC1025]|uniref:ATP-binding cassette domain-containing protein n=1 Tax=Spirosoma sp. KNUC1025 TaxID=2894082 RepID=UPI0038682A04|nr:ABC transporter ATP-binding protein/permease [Spirosoma sp. KNUC1025]